jgi:flagellar hook-basal body complex protein FliE
MAIVEKNKEVEEKKIPLEETQEFKDALSRALADVSKELQVKTASVDPAMQSFADMLAQAIASLTDQGTGRKRVAPEIIKARIDARDKMNNLITEAYSKCKKAEKDFDEGAITSAKLKEIVSENTPIYALKNKVHLAEQVVEPFFIGPDHVARPTEIEWMNVPNEAMTPVNEIAAEIHNAFLESIGSVDWQAPDKGMYITAKGLVINGAPSATGRLRQTPVMNAVEAETGLKLRGREMVGTLKTINVLGTVAPPALQRT